MELSNKKAKREQVTELILQAKNEKGLTYDDL